MRFLTLEISNVSPPLALKEASETGYWLELLYKTNYIGEEQYSFLESKCKSLRAMLVSSINTAKNNNK